MKRHAINRLQEWKEDPNRLPLIIRGARSTERQIEGVVFNYFN